MAHASIASLLWPVVNFTLFVLLLSRFLGGPMREFFRGRAERLRAALTQGARAREEAEAVRAAISRDLAEMPALRERLRGDLRAAAEQEREKILGAARRLAERIRADAHLLAEQEAAIAGQGLRAELTEEIVREATVILRDAVRPEDQEALVRDFVASAGAAA